jgi:PAP2 superfamily protein
MKKYINSSASRWMLTGKILLTVLFFSACRKEINHSQAQDEVATSSNSKNLHGHLQQTNTFSSEAVLKWIDLNRRILLTTTRTAPGVRVNREISYTGIALYESVVPGMPAYQSLSSQLNQMPAMPTIQRGFAYHWAASANAALAAMNRFFFPTTSTANKTSMDSLESALNLQYQSEADMDELQRSIQFGKDVAKKVSEWSITDGADHAFDSYTPPVGGGLWVPTPPALGAAVAPYWGNNRTMVPGSINGALPPPPLPYSEVPSSDFFKMEKEVYDVSQSLTAEQSAIGLFWLDTGIGAGGHWLAILKTAVTDQDSKLDVAALAYAKGGIYINDATISAFKTKYTYNIERPISYIRIVLGHPTWNPLFATPAHPDYTSAHTVQSAAIAVAFTSIFGNNYQFTDHQFDNIGMLARSYSSFNAAVTEVAIARVYAGIHTRMGCEAGLAEGEKVANNINASLKFLKE